MILILTCLLYSSILPQDVSSVVPDDDRK